MHKRRATGGKKKAWRKKRKYVFFFSFVIGIRYNKSVSIAVLYVFLSLDSLLITLSSFSVLPK